MKSSNISFYFVLYIVAMVTVFVITMERDDLLKQRDEDLAHLVEVYVKPLALSAYVDTARFFIEQNQPITREPVRIRAKVDGPVDKSDVVFSLLDAHRLFPEETEQPIEGTMLNEAGDGVLMTSPLQEGVYRFMVAANTRRITTMGNKMHVFIRDTTYTVGYSPRLENVDRDTTFLIAKVERSGVSSPPITLSVQEAVENWVVGPAFNKKIFLSGAENPDLVVFGASAGRIERSPEASFVTFVWDVPALGKRSFTVTADARRGLGERDRAATTFMVDVLPATFVTPPSEKGFWGIPYAFDGQIAGLSPLDLSVDIVHDGQPMENKPAVPKIVLVPERNWKSLAFSVLYRGTKIKDHRAALTAPPPPQIKWVQQNIDRDKHLFVISAAASDPVGGAVTLSLQSQPPGIARLDKIRGTSFTISVNLEGKPSAVFLKLTATDQYGGTSVSSKQFNIPQ